MSAYPSATFLPLLSCPARLALDALQRVIMRGVPSLGLTTPDWENEWFPRDDGSWPQPTTGAPEDHFFLPKGTRLYRSDLPEDVKGCAITLHQDPDASRRSEDDPRFWLIPLQVQLLWIRPLTGPETDLLLRFAEQFLTCGFNKNGTIHEARHYLSSANFHVFDIRDIKSGPVKQTDGWKTALSISFTLLCSGADRPS